MKMGIFLDFFSLPFNFVASNSPNIYQKELTLSFKLSDIIGNLFSPSFQIMAAVSGDEFV